MYIDLGVGKHRIILSIVPIGFCELYNNALLLLGGYKKLGKWIISFILYTHIYYKFYI